jgi:hypothetical protein
MSQRRYLIRLLKSKELVRQPLGEERKEAAAARTLIARQLREP